MLREGFEMVLILFIKLFDKFNVQDTGVLWYGAAFALLIDVFIISILVYWLRVLQMETNDEKIISLARFALDVLAEWPDMGSLDGGDLQEIAVKHNILIPHIVHGPCCDECFCGEFYDAEEWLEGVTCYRYADWLTRAAQLRNEAVGELADSSPKDLRTEDK